MVCQTYCHEDVSHAISFAASFGWRRKLSFLKMAGCRGQLAAQEGDAVEFELSGGMKGTQAVTTSKV
jgi:hypothetical protein